MNGGDFLPNNVLVYQLNQQLAVKLLHADIFYDFISAHFV